MYAITAMGLASILLYNVVVTQDFDLALVMWLFVKCGYFVDFSGAFWKMIET